MHFVLVHGAGHGGWCWYKIQHLLHKAGHQVTAIDLAGAGRSTQNPNTILSFDDYNAPLIELLSILPASNKVVVVGHSAGGLSFTHASLLSSEKISVAVYIATTMRGVPNLFEEYEFKYGLGLNDPPTSAMFRKQVQRQLLYQLSPPEDAMLASMLLRPAPCLAFQSARFDGPEKGSRIVPRVYIKTLQDRVLKLDQQEAMIQRWPPQSVLHLDTDHCPFFSAPLELHRLLLSVASTYS
eukprot:Gb_12800 [translate_table: standard]